jgi:RNA 3'-terminal phosphate cyclase (ATP)
MVELNGGHGEGGGALLRTALSLSALTAQPIRIHTIRGAQRKPGLCAEDLAFLWVLEQSCRAEVEGADLGSDSLIFRPAVTPQPVRLEVDIQRFGRGRQSGCALVLAQALWPVLARAGGPSRLTLQAETHGSASITYEAFHRATAHVMAHQAMGAIVDMTLAGYDRDADGVVHIEIEPSRPEALEWTQPWDPEEAGAVLVWSGLNERDVEIAAERIEEELEAEGWAPYLDAIEAPSKGRGACLTVWRRSETGCYAASSSLKRSVRMDDMARPAAANLARWQATGAAVDPFLADQMILTAAMAEGRTEYTTAEITRRLTTMARLIRQLMGVRIAVLGAEGGPGRVVVER